MNAVTWDNQWGKDATLKGMNDMVGKVPIKINETSYEIVFIFDDGAACKFYHYQDCCESVSIDDVNGDWDDMIGMPILLAEERDGKSGNTEWGHETWTFYTFRSIKGSVDVRWHGESNGYYSESVDFISGKVQ